MLAVDGAAVLVVVPAAEAGRRVTVNFPEDEELVVDDVTAWVGVEPERPSKRIV